MARTKPFVPGERLSLSDQPSIIVLVTTYNRPELLKARALTSIQNQTSSPDGIVLVDNSDSESTQKKNRSIFKKYFAEGEYLVNKRTPGAAGTWNHGLHWINENHPGAWVSIIDDDDEWTVDHITTCKLQMRGKDAVISGIRTLLDGESIEDRLPESLSIKAFFAKNPGWQGSNTFMRVSSLLRAGGFDEELLCTHDRDLAIRCLSMESFDYALTGKVTMLYHLERNRDSLTMTKGSGKHTGLLQFYLKHQAKMDVEDEENFIKRASDLFGINPSLFAIVDTSNDYPGFPRASHVGGSGQIRYVRRFILAIKRSWGRLRTGSILTRLFGREFIRTREKIEIDLTYACNLCCHDCNRSCRQAPEGTELKFEQVQRFIDDSFNRGIEWKRVRLLGGEPTLHSRFEEILYELAKYKLRHPKCRLEVVTNGHGLFVQRKLMQVPPFFHIENTMKETDYQPYFYSFNLAPKDRRSIIKTNFTNGCSVIEECGIGLTPSGYYPCAIAGGIDRVAGWDIGRQKLPDESDDMLDLLQEFCSHCGRFDSRVFIPHDLTPASTPDLMSPTWKKLYEGWRSKQVSR